MLWPSATSKGFLGALQGVLQQHSDCHWTHTAWDWRDGGRHLTGLCIVDISYKAVAPLLGGILQIANADLSKRTSGQFPGKCHLTPR